MLELTRAVKRLPAAGMATRLLHAENAKRLLGEFSLLSLWVEDAMGAYDKEVSLRQLVNCEADWSGLPDNWSRDQVAIIRAMNSFGKGADEIAKQLRCAEDRVRRLLHGRTYSRVH